ncbi:hypothetical protein EA462_14340 [Natrarchaeobius halalkaliphilus]|uniref:Cation-transporting P-type ATPase N-terminal domain-containing protein n=1 Tax=Natrarchaeobius halalkaliphilus TaxID=1679091 RepID=A0A3N6M5L5_9EURY|nr:cation-transporting P-type ATPase [Natrarchaeobius halalkaliphilus]RQG88029.1 hypothetical protein EA462_14340 [Natrarchaeobius halalkaliphilus]
MPLGDVSTALETSERGLDPEDARARLGRAGPNEIEAEEGVSPLRILFGVEPLGLVHWVQIAIAAAVFALLMALFVTVEDRYFERY